MDNMTTTILRFVKISCFTGNVVKKYFNWGHSSDPKARLQTEVCPLTLNKKKTTADSLFNCARRRLWRNHGIL